MKIEFRARMRNWISEQRGVKAAMSIVLIAVAGCSVGPDYHRPGALKSQPIPDAFSNVGFTNIPSQWKVAEPSAYLPHGEWWKIFDDGELDRLEMLAATENQDLATAAARLEEARAQLGVAR